MYVYVCVGNQSTINGIEIECHPCLDLCIVCLWVKTPGIVHRRKINARILEEKGKRRRDKRRSPHMYCMIGVLLIHTKLAISYDCR